MSNKNSNVKGPSKTIACTMSGSQIKRFGITKEQNGHGEQDFGAYRESQATSRWRKKMTEGMRTLRQMQGIADTKVPAPVRSAIKYFSVPFTKDESGNKQERRKLSAYEATGDDPTKVVLKV
jgi:hypothetical protein